MIESSFKSDLETRLYGDIWGAATPQEAARVLALVYGSEAIIEAFRREHEASQNDDFSRVVFWACAQEYLAPHPVKLLH